MKHLTLILIMAVVLSFNMGCVHASKGVLTNEPTEEVKPAYTFDGDVDVAQFFTDDYVRVEAEMLSETTALVYMFGKDVDPTVAVLGVLVSGDGFSVFAYCYFSGIMEFKSFILEVEDDKVHYAEHKLPPEVEQNFKDKLSEVYKKYMVK